MLILVRHGRTATNAEGRLLGHADPPLDAVGRAQAHAVKAELASLAAGARIVSSPLVRTRETAEIIARTPLDIDPRWIELDYGAFDGRPLVDIPAETWATWRTDPDFAPEGGESLRALSERVEGACEELITEAADRDVIVVTHVSPLKAAVVWALGVGPEVTWRTFVAPGSITRIATRPNGPVLVSFNETPWSSAGGVGEADG